MTQFSYLLARVVQFSAAEVGLLLASMTEMEVWAPIFFEGELLLPH